MSSQNKQSAKDDIVQQKNCADVAQTFLNKSVCAPSNIPHQKSNEQQQPLDEELELQNYQQVYQSLNSGMYQVSPNMNQLQNQQLTSSEPAQQSHQKQGALKNGVRLEPNNQQLKQQTKLQNESKLGVVSQQKVLSEQLQQRLGIKHSQLSYPSIEIDQNNLQQELSQDQQDREVQLKQPVYQQKQQKIINASQDNISHSRAQQIEQQPQQIQSPSTNSTNFQFKSPNTNLQTQTSNKKLSLQQRCQTHKTIPVSQKSAFKANVQQELQKSSKLLRRSTSASQIHFDQVSIIGYEKTFFLKIQTQIYQIQVKNSRKVYTIKRRFIDFALLYKLVLLQFSGYILYPFPRKTLQLLKQLKFSIGDEFEKMISIQKRILQLQKFMQYLVRHKQIGQSRLLSSFLTEQYELYTIVMHNLENKIIEEQKQYQLGIITENYNSLKSMVVKGFNLFQNYVKKSAVRDHQNFQVQMQFQNQSRQLQQQYQPIRKQLAQNKQRAQHLYDRAEILKLIYKNNSQVCNIQSNIDSILILSTKLTSSKSYYEHYYQWIDDNILYEVKHFLSLFEQIQQQIAYRSSLLNRVGRSSQIDKNKKIIQKVQLFDSRFIADWEENLIIFEESLSHIYKQFSLNWKRHCLLMSKIWK